VDWSKIKAEYIAGGTSYRKLCEKYNIKLSALRFKAEKEKWTELKAQAQHSANTKIVEAIATQKSEYNVDIYSVADKLLEKITSMLEEDGLTTQSIKHLTSAIKDIKEIKGIKSDIDLKEQNARIDKLRKEIEADNVDNNKPSGVVLMPPIMDNLVPPKGEDNGQ
jgi:hypothetical protein